MPKIQTYELTEIPLSLNDMLIGTEIGGPIPFATKNFSLGQLFDFFQEQGGAINLQQVLDNGNTATQSMTLIGSMSTTTLATETIELVGRFFDSAGSEGTAGQVLTSTGSETLWSDPVGGEFYVTVTRGELIVIIEESLVIPGATYFVDGEYFLTGLTPNQVSIEGSRKMRVPRTYLDGAEIDGAVWRGVFYQNISDLSIGQKVIWGGYVWVSTTGTSVEPPVNDVLLDPTEWSYSVSEGDFILKSFDIIYDLDNNWVSQQRDEFNNVVGISFWTAQNIGLAYNPVDITDWNMFTSNPSVRFGNNTVNQGFFNNRAYLYNNHVTGTISQNTGRFPVDYAEIIHNTCDLDGSILGNAVTSISQNNMPRGCVSNVGPNIYNNNCASISSNAFGSGIYSNDMLGFAITGNTVAAIENNSCRDINSNSGDYIGYNTCTNDIANNSVEIINKNSNKGGISSNGSNVSEISYNSNAGQIVSNNNTGYISYNTNVGNIQTISSITNNIFRNTNNGNIVTSVAGNISDPQVNK